MSFLVRDPGGSPGCPARALLVCLCVCVWWQCTDGAAPGTSVRVRTSYRCPCSSPSACSPSPLPPSPIESAEPALLVPYSLWSLAGAHTCTVSFFPGVSFFCCRCIHNVGSSPGRRKLSTTSVISLRAWITSILFFNNFAPSARGLPLRVFIRSLVLMSDCLYVSAFYLCFLPFQPYSDHTGSFWSFSNLENFQ